MTALHSPQWFRVAHLRPQLDRGAVVRRQVVRRQVWRTLARADGSRSLRLNGAAWSWVGRCDGQHSVQQLWEAALRELRDAAPTQDEVLDALSRLHGAGLLSFDRPPDFAAEGPMGAPAAPEAPPSRRQSWMAWRIPLGHPDAAMARVARLLEPWLLSRLVWLLMGLAVLQLGITAATHAGELAAAAQSLAASPRALWLGLLVFLPIKLLHESAHGIVARLHGARVPEWGITLLMFMPVPYVDASAASALPRAGQRLGVAGAGIAAEGLVAAIALPIALNVQPGWVRDTALTVFLIGALSTLAVNANPLLRFDGYHMLCDAAGLPNLATRSQRWWAQRLQRWAYGADALPGTLQPAPGEVPWLVAYAPAATAMRWVVALGVVWWLASLSFAAGVAAAAAFAVALVVKPGWAAWKAWQSAPLAASRRSRAALRMGIGAAVVAGAVGIVPVPDSTLARGVWWLPEPALVRTQVDGFVAELYVAPGDAVEPGTPLLRLHAPALEAEQGRLASRLDALRGEHWQALSADAARAVQVDHEIEAVRADLARLNEQLEQRQVRAQRAGRVAIDRATDLPGRWLARGSLVAHIAGSSPGLVQVAVPHEQAALLMGAGHDVELRRSSAPHQTLRGRWDGQASGAGARLPSAALGERSGGPIPTDPADAEGLRPAQAVLLAEIQLEPGSVVDSAAWPASSPGSARTAGAPGGRVGAMAAERIGERVWVRFRHGWSPLARQAARSAQQLVLRHFNPGQ